MALFYRRTQVGQLTLASAVLAVAFALTALVVHFTYEDSFGGTASEGDTTTIVLAVATIAVAVVSAAYAWLARQRQMFETGLSFDRAEALGGLVLEQQAEIVSEVHRYLLRISPFESVTIVGYARTVLELIDELPNDFVTRRNVVRVVLMEDESYGEMRDFASGSWRFGKDVDIRTLRSATKSSIIMAGDQAFYNLMVPGAERSASLRGQPWLTISGARSGPLWYEWQDQVERLWRDAEPLESWR